MEVKISLTNSKLGNQIPSINLPALKTCVGNCGCRQKCYATKGNYRFPNVQKSHMNNLMYFIHDSKKYFDDIIAFFNGLTTYRYARHFSSGDCPNYEYFLGIIRVAKKCKQTNFLMFTKKFDIVNKYLSEGHKIPKNLHIKFSAWDKDFKVDNPYNLPVAYVNFKDKTLNPKIPEDAFPCCGSCETCGVGCWKYDGDVVFNEH